MRIIMLAAGKGERLLPLTRNTPKSLLDIGTGRTLLEEQMDRIKKSGVITEVVIIVGYLAEQIEAKIKRFSECELPVRTIYNPFYDVSNNLISLWCARGLMDEDFLITNGDAIFSHDIYRGLVSENQEGIIVSATRKDQYDADDMRIRMEGGYITHISKNIPCDQADAESPGLAMVRGLKARQLFAKKLEQIVRSDGARELFWLEVFNGLSDDGYPIVLWPFDGTSKWQEVDFWLDIEKARRLIQIRVDL